MISAPETESRAGFKKTKLGWIPEDWELTDFKSTTKINQGLQIPIAERQLHKTESNFFYITNEFLNPKSEKRYFVENPTSNVICDLDDILMTRTGNTGQVVRNVKGVFHNNFFKIKTADNLDKKFLYQFLIDNRTQDLILRFAGVSTIPDLNHGDFYRIKVPLPPLEEQKAIANCLSTWDTAITKLDTLIKAKQQLKKALMQQLLSGKKRLPGFDGEWETNRFDYFLDYNPRPVEKPFEPFTKLGIRSHCKGTFQNNDFKPEDIAITTLYRVEPDDLIVNITFAWEGAIAIVKDVDKGALVSHRFPTYTFKEDLSYAGYFRQFIRTKKFRFLLELISPGGAGRNRVLSKKELNKLKITIPSYEEQTAIAQVLNTADQEIALLTTQRNQLQLQKKGLMQQLLTGKKRLK